jgi:membrane protein DedA with SNARE-associated domain
MLRKEMIPTCLIIIMGVIDCVTTVIGVLYSGDRELNPIMAGILSTNIGFFMFIKLAATMFAAASYILARRILMRMPDKTGKSFTYSFHIFQVAYAALIAFLFIVIANNVLILIR